LYSIKFIRKLCARHRDPSRRDRNLAGSLVDFRPAGQSAFASGDRSLASFGLLSLWSVELLDAVEHILAGFDAGLAGPPPYSLAPQEIEEALGNRMICGCLVRTGSYVGMRALSRT
tara:strand:- start:46400 stop:46747 length:348 start_codon:yes stop_codon:yes gene_type:complete